MEPDGTRFECPSDVPLLGAAHAADILISYSCRSGQCGSCIGRLLAGEIEYPRGRPEALDAGQARAGYVLFCSAHARSDLVIELLKPDFAGGEEDYSSA